MFERKTKKRKKVLTNIQKCVIIITERRKEDKI